MTMEPPTQHMHAATPAAVPARGPTNKVSDAGAATISSAALPFPAADGGELPDGLTSALLEDVPDADGDGGTLALPVAELLTDAVLLSDGVVDAVGVRVPLTDRVVDGVPLDVAESDCVDVAVAVMVAD
jgi:hypothetical protein